MSKTESLQQGPYSITTTKTIEVAGPIKFTVVTKTDSTHVPPSGGCGCGGSGGGMSISDLMSAVGMAAHNVAMGDVPRAPAPGSFGGEGNPAD